jgi:hypothetical protein
VFSSNRSHAITACLKANGKRTRLDHPPDTVVYPRPAIDLGGYYVAYAIEGTDDPNAEDDTIIQMRDLRTGHTPAVFSPDRGGAYATSRKNFFDAKVGSLRVRPNGSVAWIACRTRDNLPEEWGNPRPTCIRSGAMDEVRIMRAGESRPETLEVSRKIEPRSLRVGSGRIRWKSGGRTRSAPLP